MAGFLQDFLHAEFATLSRKDPPRVYLAAFGKHPGWNDHIEDIGLDTVTLINAKRYLYLQGLSGQIDSNAWEKLDASGRLESFDHWLFWHRPGECLIGRLWSSSDGKGRTRYPMALLIHGVGVTASWILSETMTLLNDLAEGCRSVTTAAEVQQLVVEGTAELRGKLARVEEPPGSRPPFRDPISSAALGETERLRIFHVIVNQFSTFAPGTVDFKSDAAARGRHVRLPRLGGPASQDFVFWTAFLLTQLDPNVPTLLYLPATANWVDAVVGEPTSADFYGLRANLKTLPAAQDVPYQLTPALREAVLAVHEGGLESGLPTKSIFSNKPTADLARGLLSNRDDLWATSSGGILKRFCNFLGG